MFSVSYDLRNRVVWTSFSGVFTAEDLRNMNDIGMIILEAEGTLNCVFDFSACTGTSISRDQIVQRARRPSSEKAIRRIIVASHPDLLALAHSFAATQALLGDKAPVILHSPDEVAGALGVSSVHPKPVDIDWLKDQLHFNSDEASG